MDEQEKLISCLIVIKQAPAINYYSYNDHTTRAAAQEKALNTNKENFYKIVNAVVDLGGVICMDKYHLDSDYRMVVSKVQIKIPKSKIDELRKIPEVVSIN